MGSLEIVGERPLCVTNWKLIKLRLGIAYIVNYLKQDAGMSIPGERPYTATSYHEQVFRIPAVEIIAYFDEVFIRQICGNLAKA